MASPCAKIGNISFRLISVQKNKIYVCEEDCYHASSCDVKQKLMINPLVKNLCVTEALLEVFNPTAKTWELERSCWSLIDTDAYTYSPSNICYHFDSVRILDDDSIDVSPGTKVRVCVRFPELEPDAEVSAVLFAKDEEIAKLEIRQLKPEVQEAIDLSRAESLLSECEEESETTFLKDPRYAVERNKLGYLWPNLEKACFSRIHNILIPKEAVKLENEIQNTAFSIEQVIKSVPKPIAEENRSRLTAFMEQYNAELKAAKKTEAKRVSINQTVDALYELTDRAFEEWTEDLFSNLGYDTQLTPQSNDNGIDVICRKDGKLVVVQCKKYKGAVGRPDIQKFLGAIQNAGADEGYFLTTSTFSIGAEKAAQGTNLILCDKFKIAELIEMALKNENA